MTARAVCHTFKNLYTNFLLPPFVQLRNQLFKEFLLSSPDLNVCSNFESDDDNFKKAIIFLYW